MCVSVCAPCHGADLVTCERKGLLTNLSVCKDSGIVAFKAAFNKSLGAVVVYGFLLGVHVEDVVVGKGLVLAQDHLWLPGHDKGADVTALDLLFGQLRTDPGRQNEAKTVRFLTAHHKPSFPGQRKKSDLH